VKTFVVKITRAGMPTVRYTGIHPSAADAMVIAMDIAAQTGPVDQPIGISAKAVTK
jgi:hypothetical protein